MPELMRALVEARGREAKKAVEQLAQTKRHRKKLRMRTSLGVIEVLEQTYWDRRRQREIRALSEVCGIKARGYSRRLQRAITDFAADVPFERAADKIHGHYGISIPTSSCRSIALRHAARLTPHILPEAPAKIAETLIGEADGSMVPIVLIDDAATGDRRRHRTLVWKEAKFSLVRRSGEVSTLVAATFGDPAACGMRHAAPNGTTWPKQPACAR